VLYPAMRCLALPPEGRRRRSNGTERVTESGRIQLVRALSSTSQWTNGRGYGIIGIDSYK